MEEEICQLGDETENHVHEMVINNTNYQIVGAHGGNQSGTNKNDVWMEFIEIYHSEISLWKIKSKDYSNRDKKASAYNKLLEKYKEIFPHGTITDVKKKINNMRTNFRKELKKVEASKRSCASTDDIYEPSLWYFNHLLFLVDQDTPALSITNIYNSGEDDYDDPGLSRNVTATPPSPIISMTEYTSRSPCTTPVSTSASAPGLPTRRRYSNEATEVLNVIKEKLSAPAKDDDYFDLVAKTWAAKMRRLPSDKQVITEKAINDILFDAEMGYLNYPRPTHGQTLPYCQPTCPNCNTHLKETTQNQQAQVPPPKCNSIHENHDI